MKKSLILSALMLCAFTFTQAQSTVSLPVTDQKLQELINEVKSLRAELQRMNANAYRTQILLERHKAQQEQVSRLTKQLADVHDQLSGVRDEQVKFKEFLSEAEKGREKGLVGDKELNGISAMIKDFQRREVTLTQRELQLASELNTEREALNDLTARLDLLEKEILPLGNEGTKKRE